MIRTIIVEDEVNSRELLKNLLMNYCGNVEVVASTGSVQEAKDLIAKFDPDLLLLDIELGDGNGFDLLEFFPKPKFLLVFVSVYDQYGIRAIKSQAFDFILKPVRIGELKSTIQQVEEKLQEKSMLEVLNPKRQDEITAEGNSLVIKSGKSFEVVQIQEVARLYSDAPYTMVVSKKEKHMVSLTLSEFEALLPDSFFRVHRSHIVNLNYVVSWETGRGGSLVLADGIEIPISYRSKREFEQKMAKLGK